MCPIDVDMDFGRCFLIALLVSLGNDVSQSLSIALQSVLGGFRVKLSFFECVAEVRDSPKFFKISRILLKYYHIIMTMGGMY
jgi:hypothetical protein